VARGYKTEAVVLRSLRLGEADRVLHLYTATRGRVGAVAKGIRRTTSRFGARLEPLSHVEVLLHQGSGELHTVTGVHLLASHRATREDPYRLGVGLVGAEAMLRLFTEQEANDKAFTALARFLDAADALPTGASSTPALDPLALSFQLKLLWLSGYLPHLASCAECGAEPPLVGFLPKAGGAVCRACAAGAIPLSAGAVAAMGGLLRRPLAAAGEVSIRQREARETLAVIKASYEYHGGFRLRSLQTA
jgi:DNA repair protein RecO (recombination protein O)